MFNEIIITFKTQYIHCQILNLIYFKLRQRELFRVLKAYSILNSEEIGYCQAQAPVAAMLLMHMPAEEAFWCLVAICQRYLPGYYNEGLVMNNCIIF